MKISKGSLTAPAGGKTGKSARFQTLHDVRDSLPSFVEHHPAVLALFC
jgi:hypothetical protein